MKLVQILQELGPIDASSRDAGIQTLQQSSSQPDMIKQQIIMAVTKADLKNHQQVQELIKFLEGSLNKLKHMR